MGVRGLFEGWHLVVLILLVVILFGWKRLPDAARSLGRSMRIFKAEVEEMKGDSRSAASQDTVRGQTVGNETGQNQTTEHQAPEPEQSSPVQETPTQASGTANDAQPRN